MEAVTGIRGVIGRGLTPDIACKYASAYGSMMGPGEIVVGSDGRPSGSMLFQAVCAGLRAVGCNMLDLGIVTTPTIQLILSKRGAQGGIAITASHNPQEWNALKFFSTSSLFLDENEGAELKRRLSEGIIEYVRWDRLGDYQKYPDAIEDHIEAVLDIPYLNLAGIRDRNFKVAIDCVNGSGSLILPELLNELGCTVAKVNCEPTGIFPRPAEPLPENLAELSALVVEEKADIGFAVDPDGDRLAIVDEKGHPIGEEYSLVLVADFVLSKKKGPVVSNVSTTRALDDIAQKHNVSIFRTKVGEVHVAKRMAVEGAVIGGEGNGGIILPEVHLGRDAPVGIALVLQSLLESETTLSRVWETLPQYRMVKDKIRLEKHPAVEILPSLDQSFENAFIDRTDGLKFIFTHSWVQVRASNTEPIIRIFAEAKDAESASQLVATFKEKIIALEK
jgi:phosphomannomutase